MVEHLFSGSALCRIEANGALILPRFVRATLARRADSPLLLVGAHECDPCLIAYDRGYARVLHADAERRRIAEELSVPGLSSTRMRRIFGFSEEVGCDDAGMILLPPMMRRRARIGSLALVVGTGGAFELWAPEQAQAHDDPEIREIAAFHLDVQHAA